MPPEVLVEMMDFVNRRPDGSYLLGVTGFGVGSAVVPMMSVPRTEEEVEQESEYIFCPVGSCW